MDSALIDPALLDPALNDHASAPNDPDTSSEDEGESSQNPSSPISPTVPSVNQSEKLSRYWPDADKEYLIFLRQSNGMAWDDISRRLTENNPYLGNRSPDACRQRYNAISDKPRDYWPYTASEEQLLFGLRKAGYPPTKLSDEFPERNEAALNMKWIEMATPVDHKPNDEWNPVEDLQLGHLQREGNSWSLISQSFPSHSAAECLIRFSELHSLPYPCPPSSATPWEREEIAILISMRNK